MDESGPFLNFADFCRKYNLSCTIKQYTEVICAIPPAIICTLKGSILYIHLIRGRPALMVQERPFVDKKCNKLLNFPLTPKKMI